MSIVQIAGIISAVTVILGAAWKIHVALRRIEDRFDRYEKTMNENTIHLLKMALMCEDLPIIDRINAGERYLELGGNGYGKIVYERLVAELRENPPTALERVK